MFFFLTTSSAFAFDADTFEPAGSSLDEQGGLQVLSPSIGWAGSGYAGIGLVYAVNPVVRLYENGDQEAVVGGLFSTRLSGGYNVAGKVRIDLDLPLYPYVGAADPAEAGFALGDARLSTVIPVIRRGDSPFGLAVVPLVNLPTGGSAFTRSGFGAGLGVAAGLAPTDRLFFDANVGGFVAQADALGEFSLGSGLLASIGGGMRVGERFTVGAELDSNISLAGGVGVYNENPVELHAYGTYGAGRGLVATLGFGTGIVAGIGAPELRVIGAVGWHFPGKPPVYDVDLDGVSDDVDACVDAAEDLDEFEDSDGCPELDNDTDGVADTRDACILDPEDKDFFEDEDGCPERDNDRDGLVDSLDACPVDAGPETTVGCPDTDADRIPDLVDVCPTVAGPERTKGCPDRDADLVPDSRDACPDTPKDPREDPERSDGCPKRVFVTGVRIEILEKIFFDTAKTTIKKESFALLQEVADTLNRNLDITRVAVDGHTDSDGEDAKNLTISQGRADAVVKWLTTTGKVDPTRLYGVGYGETKPIDANATPTGKTNNRRVEFVIKGTTRDPAP